MAYRKRVIDDQPAAPKRRILVIALGCLVLGTAGAYAYVKNVAAPFCDDSDMLDLVSSQFRKANHLDGIFIWDMQDVSTSWLAWFARTRDCTAIAAQIRSQVEISKQPQMHMVYSMSRDFNTGQGKVVVDLTPPTITSPPVGIKVQDDMP